MGKLRNTIGAVACGILVLVGCSSGPGKPAWWQFSWQMPTIKLPTIKSSSDKDHLDEKAVTLSEKPEQPQQPASSRASAAPKMSSAPAWKPEVNSPASLAARPAMEPNPAGAYERELSHAQALDRAGQSAAARTIYERLVLDAPSRPEAYHRLGRLLAAREERHREAEGLYAQAIRLNPRNAEVLNDLGYTFYCQGNLAQAENATLRAVALQPSDPQLRANLGVIYGHQGRSREALEQLRLAGSEADACANLATILVARNDRLGAKEYLRRALAAEPGHARAKQALEALSAEEGPKTENPLRMANDPPQRSEKAVR